MRLHIDFDEHSEAGRYFLTCARIRDICAMALMRRLFEAITEDQLTASVLDDSETMKERRKGEHRYFDPPSVRGQA